MGEKYGMGNRRLGTGCGFGDSRSGLYHLEKMNLSVSDKLGAKQISFSPIEAAIALLK
jgi:hypothetical protein